MTNDDWESLSDQEQRMKCLELAQDCESQNGKWKPTSAAVLKRARAYHDFLKGKGDPGNVVKFPVVCDNTKDIILFELEGE